MLEVSDTRQVFSVAYSAFSNFQRFTFIKCFIRNMPGLTESLGLG